MDYYEIMEYTKNSPPGSNNSVLTTFGTGSGNNGARDRHVHEFLGSTKFAERGDDRHNHRVAGVTGEAIPIGNGGHVHKFRTNVDFFENHFHEVAGTTCPNIEVGNGRHVHFADVVTTIDDGHRHRLTFATLIENPAGPR
jgi:hypothetical protein